MDYDVYELMIRGYGYANFMFSSPTVSNVRIYYLQPPLPPCSTAPFFPTFPPIPTSPVLLLTPPPLSWTPPH